MKISVIVNVFQSDRMLSNHPEIAKYLVTHLVNYLELVVYRNRAKLE
jgi:hypothetical protein